MKQSRRHHSFVSWEAALGTETDYDTVDGRISVKIPAGIQSGDKIRVARRGYINDKGKRGICFSRFE